MNTRRFTQFREHRLVGVVRLSLMAVVAAGLAFAYILFLSEGGAAEIGAAPNAAAFNRATYSSPITLSANNRLVWAINAGADTVSVIDTLSNTEIAEIPTGDEPQGVALTPDNKHAYVANAAAGSVTVINILNANPATFKAAVFDPPGPGTALITGAEPYNIVASPNGRRVFVANSGQDTITIIDTSTQRIIGNVNLRNSVCNAPDLNRRFQPRGMAVTLNNTRLFVTRFLSFIKAGGKQAQDNGREGLVCRLDINTQSAQVASYRPVRAVRLAAQVTGFKVDANGDGTLDNTAAFPNQLQSIVIRGNSAYLPNIAASPSGPQLFNVSTQAFVHRISGINTANQIVAPGFNTNLGAQDPEPGKPKLFFANAWAIAFTNQAGAGTAYVVSAGSDLLVKLNVRGNGALGLTVDGDTTRYIDLNDPDNPATSGDNAGKNPLGIVINNAGTTAYVKNNVSGNVSVVDLTSDSVLQAIRTVDLPPPGSLQERVAVGAEMFFSSRGNFDPIPGATISLRNRLSASGWQSCASCHFEGLTDGVIWAFGTGARKSIPLNATFNPHNRTQQRVLNYSSIMDEVEDFENNIRNVSGPGPLAAAVPCDNGSTTSTFNPNQGLLLGVGNVNNPPCVIAQFIPPNANRPQVTVTLPGSNVHVPALTALKQWVQFAIRTPSGASNLAQAAINAGRALFQQAGCQACHGGPQWTSSIKNFVSPPATANICTEVANTDPTFCGGDGPTPAPVFGNPIAAQYLAPFLRDIQSFALNVQGSGNAIPGQPLIGGVEKVAPGGLVVPPFDGLGTDYNNDGEGDGFSPPSLLSIGIVPPYYHNGACETLACVLRDVNHRSAGNGADVLVSPRRQALVVQFLESIDADTAPIVPSL